MKIEQEYEVIVAINTFATFLRFDLEHGVYANSPLLQSFDGSATGYWKRRAEFFGATPDELGRIERDLSLEVRENKARRLGPVAVPA